MKLRNAVLLAVIVAAGAACDKGTSPPTPASAEVLQHPLFWQLERDGHTSYLLGTIHIGVDPARLPAIVGARLDAAKAFAMETDLSQASSLDLRRSDGTTLADELGPAYWAKLEAALGAPAAAQLLHVKTMIPATQLALRGLPATPPMDSVLHDRAVRRQARIVFLEPFADEIAVLEKWLDARALRDMLDDLAANERRAREMLEAYVAGDEARMLAITDAERAQWKAHGHPEREFDEQLEDLLYKRNASWIVPIEALHAAGGAFIAVGAAHTVGPRSVVELLEKRGFRVTRVAP